MKINAEIESLRLKFHKFTGIDHKEGSQSTKKKETTNPDQ